MISLYKNVMDILLSHNSFQ